MIVRRVRNVSPPPSPVAIATSHPPLCPATRAAVPPAGRSRVGRRAGSGASPRPSVLPAQFARAVAGVPVSGANSASHTAPSAVSARSRPPAGSGAGS